MGSRPTADIHPFSNLPLVGEIRVYQCYGEPHDEDGFFSQGRSDLNRLWKTGPFLALYLDSRLAERRLVAQGYTGAA